MASNIPKEIIIQENEIISIEGSEQVFRAKDLIRIDGHLSANAAGEKKGKFHQGGKITLIADNIVVNGKLTSNGEELEGDMGLGGHVILIGKEILIGVGKVEALKEGKIQVNSKTMFSGQSNPEVEFIGGEDGPTTV